MTNGKHIRNVQMIGNAGLMGLPKTAFLSSRKVAPQDVMQCYDWATGMRGGGSAGRLAPPGDGGHAGRVTLPPDFAQCGGGRRVVEAPPRWRLSMRSPSGATSIPRISAQPVFLRLQIHKSYVLVWTRFWWAKWASLVMTSQPLTNAVAAMTASGSFKPPSIRMATAS